MKKLFSDHKFTGLDLITKTNIIVLTLTLILLIYISTQRLFISESQSLNNEPSKRDFCNLIMQQMVKRNLSKKLVEVDLHTLITRDDYKALYFKGDESIKGIWTNNDSCKVFLNGVEGIRVFDLYLSDSGNYPFYYLLRKVTEHELNEEEV